VEQREEGELPAGSIGGIVRSFVASKAYGFIAGDDGESYFVHLSEVQGGEALITDQRVTFVPRPSPKGFKATRVIPGVGPTAIYEEPTHFLVTNAPQPLDVDVILVMRDGWAESNDPNRARQELIDLAKSWGRTPSSTQEWTVTQKANLAAITSSRCIGFPGSSP
jgi:cold shock CspA family protein